MANIIIYGIPSNVNEDSLKTAFTKFGELSEIILVTFPNFFKTNQQKTSIDINYCYIKYKSVESVKKVVLGEVTILGKKLVIKEATNEDIKFQKSQSVVQVQSNIQPIQGGLSAQQKPSQDKIAMSEKTIQNKTLISPVNPTKSQFTGKKSQATPSDCSPGQLLVKAQTNSNIISPIKSTKKPESGSNQKLDTSVQIPTDKHIRRYSESSEQPQTNCFVKGEQIDALNKLFTQIYLAWKTEQDVLATRLIGVYFDYVIDSSDKVFEFSIKNPLDHINPIKRSEVNLSKIKSVLESGFDVMAIQQILYWVKTMTMIKNAPTQHIMEYFLCFMSNYFKSIKFEGIGHDQSILIKSLWRINFITENLSYLEKMVDNDQVTSINNYQIKSHQNLSITGHNNPPTSSSTNIGKASQQFGQQSPEMLQISLNSSNCELTLKAADYRLNTYKVQQKSYFHVIQQFYDYEEEELDIFKRLSNWILWKTQQKPLNTKRISGKIGNVDQTTLIEIDSETLLKNFKKTTSSLQDLAKQMGNKRAMLTLSYESLSMLLRINLKQFADQSGDIQQNMGPLLGYCTHWPDLWCKMMIINSIYRISQNDHKYAIWTLLEIFKSTKVEYFAEHRKYALNCQEKLSVLSKREILGMKRDLFVVDEGLILFDANNRIILRLFTQSNGDIVVDKFRAVIKYNGIDGKAMEMQSEIQNMKMEIRKVQLEFKFDLV